MNYNNATLADKLQAMSDLLNDVKKAVTLRAQESDLLTDEQDLLGMLIDNGKNLIGAVQLVNMQED